MVGDMKGIHAMRWLFALLCALASASAQAATTASVDRETIARDETLVYTLESDAGRGRPDLSALEQDFDILSSSQSSQVSLAGGRMSSTSTWRLTLAPKRTGILNIPPVELNGQRSPALKITVLDAASGAAQPGERGGRDLVFLQAEADRPQAYVQGQILYNVRLHTAVALNQGSIDDLEVEGAIVQPLEPHEYMKRIDGANYRVWEYRYAIFPQRAGKLEIPAIRFNGLAESPGAGGFWNAPPSRRVEAATEPLGITVLDKPADADTDWLPAGNIELREEWRGDTAPLRAGQSITRRVHLRAEGVLSSNLPALLPKQIAHARVFAEPPRAEQTQNANGSVAQRTETIAIVPTASGRVVIPPVVIKWWDTRENRWRESTLPGKTFEVGEGDQRPDAPDVVFGEAPEQADAPAGALPWQLATAAFALLWLLTLAAWFIRNRRAVPAAATLASPAPTGRGALKAALEACRLDDPVAARRQVLAWAAAQWPHEPPLTLEGLALRAGSEPLCAALEALEAALYGSSSAAAWRGEVLARALSEWRPASAHAPIETPLPGLYPPEPRG